jgi:hypothetical protein
MTPRPKKSFKEQRAYHIIFRVNEKELDEIQQMAKHYGYVNISDYARRTALGYQPTDRQVIKPEE